MACAASRLSEPAARSCMRLLLNAMHLAKQYKATQSRQNKAVLLATFASIITIMIIFAEGGGIMVSTRNFLGVKQPHVFHWYVQAIHVVL